jgi:hypothetical protein
LPFAFLTGEIVTLALATIPKPGPKPDPDAFLLAMFLMFARAPRNPNPDVDGSFNLGEIGQDREKDWERLTPYSLARRTK